MQIIFTEKNPCPIYHIGPLIKQGQWTLRLGLEFDNIYPLGSVNYEHF